MRQPVLNSIVVGAGLAGLAAAIALKQAGHGVTLVEGRSRHAVVSEGVFITLAPNGMNALKPLGAYGAVLAAGIVTTGIELLNGKGARLVLIRQGHYQKAFGAPSCTLVRGILVDILLGRAEALGVDLRFATRVTGLAGGEVAFNGLLPEPYDLIVGADGIRSTVRDLAFANAPKPSFTGQIGTGGFVDAEVGDTHGVMRMTFGDRAFFGYIAAPGKPVYWFNSFLAGPQWRKPEGGLFARQLLLMHANDPQPNADILLHVDRVDHAYPIFELPRLPSWSAGPVILIGDAAHAIGPHAGQGGSLALEDAVVLADCMTNAPDLAAAFRAYEKRRRGRIDKVAKMTARRGAAKEIKGWFALFVRDLLIRIFVRLGTRAAEKPLGFKVTD